MYISYVFCWCWHVLKVFVQIPVTGMEGLNCKKWGKMSVTDTIFGRWEIAVADNVYSKNENGTNIGAQTFNTYQYTFLSIQN